jgi:hypothetical protein
MLTRAHEIGDEECLSGDDPRECEECEGFGHIMPPAEYCRECEFAPAEDLEGQHPGGECCECMGLDACEVCNGTGYEPASRAAERAVDAAVDEIMEREGEEE